MHLVKCTDTVGEPISTLPSQPFYIGIFMVLCLQRSHTRGAIFGALEFANSICTFLGRWANNPNISMLKFFVLAVSSR